VGTTKRYIGCRQKFKEAVNDRFKISLANIARENWVYRPIKGGLRWQVKSGDESLAPKPNLGRRPLKKGAGRKLPARSNLPHAAKEPRPATHENTPFSPPTGAVCAAFAQNEGLSHF